MSKAQESAGRRGSWLLLAFSIPALLLLLALGTWQAQRLQWKEALIARIEERIAAEPLLFEEVARLQANGGDIDYLPTRLSGSFLHQFEQHYLATWRGQSGFFVHTPMRLPDGRFVFVNRGFVPYDRKEPQTRPEGQIEGEISIEGLARIAPEDKPSIIIPDNDPGQNIFYWKDLSEMIRSAGLSENEVYPFFVDVNSAPNPGGLPIGGVTRVNLPNNHLQYAVTWYGLALALVCVLFAWFWRGTGPRSDKT